MQLNDDSVNTALSRRSILLIRPVRHQDSLQDRLVDAGAQVSHIPVMSIVPANDHQRIKDLIFELDNFSKAIVVSGNAAELAIDWLDKYWPMMPVGIDFFAIGQQTADILSRFDIQAKVAAGRQNSEALLALPELQDLTQQRVIIFRGCGGRELLADTLMARGARVDYCELYQRQIDAQQVQLAREQLYESECLVAHSGELITALGDVGATELADIPVVVPSDRVAEIAQKLGYKTVVSAENPLPEAMFDAIAGVFGEGD